MEYPKAPIGGPAAWLGSDMAARTDWVETFTPAELAEIEAAVAEHLGSGRAMGEITPETFRLPSLAPRLKRIDPLVARHFPPVDPADEFAPADHLADEPLGAVERHPPGAPFGLDRAAHRQRIEQPGVEIGRNHRVIEERLPLQHGILIGPELRQAMLDKGDKKALDALAAKVNEQSAQLDTLRAAAAAGAAARQRN